MQTLIPMNINEFTVHSTCTVYIYVQLWAVGAPVNGCMSSYNQ